MATGCTSFTIQTMDKRKRETNFSDAEIRVLLELVKENHFVLFGTLNGTTITAKKKDRVWESITCSVNARGSVMRTKQQIKRKWFGLKSLALKLRKYQQNPPTGGGDYHEVPWFVDVVLDINGENSTLLDGIKGGKDSCERHAQGKVLKRKQDQNGDDISEEEEVHEPVRKQPRQDNEPGFEFDSQSQSEENCPTFAAEDRSTSSASSVAQASTLGNGTTVDRLAQLRQKGSVHHETSAHTSVSVSKETKTSQLLTSEIERVNLEKKKLQLEIDLLVLKTAEIDRGQLEMNKLRLELDLLAQQKQNEKLRTTNERLSQLKLFYQVRKLESELGVQSSVIALNVTTPCVEIIENMDESSL